MIIIIIINVVLGTLCILEVLGFRYFVGYNYLQTAEAPEQGPALQATMQAAVTAGPLSTGGVLLRLINTKIGMNMEKEVNESIFIISTINWQGAGEL